MKVLITGASGFVGYRAVEACLKTDWIETVIANDWDAQVGKKMQTMGAYFVLGHLKDREIANTITKNIDAVIHCGGRYVYWGKQEDFYRDNVVCTENLLRACRKNRVPRLVMLSSASVYHTGQERFNVSEMQALPTKMMTYQADTLLKAEELLYKAYEKGMATIALRPHFIIGRGDLDFLPQFIRLQKNNKLRILGEGNNTVDITSVDNLVHAMLLALRSPKRTWGQPFNITDDKPTPFWAMIESLFAQMNRPFSAKTIGLGMAHNKARLAEIAAKMMGNEQQAGWSTYDVSRLSTTYTLSLSKAKNLLAYRPIQTTAETLQQFVEWWQLKEQGLEDIAVIREIRDSLTPKIETKTPVVASTPTGSIDLFEPLPEELLNDEFEKESLEEPIVEEDLDLSLFEPPPEDVLAELKEEVVESTEEVIFIKKTDLAEKDIDSIDLFQLPEGMTLDTAPVQNESAQKNDISENELNEAEQIDESRKADEDSQTKDVDDGFWLFDLPD